MAITLGRDGLRLHSKFLMLRYRKGSTKRGLLMTIPRPTNSGLTSFALLTAVLILAHGCGEDAVTPTLVLPDPPPDRSPDTRRRTLTSDRGSQVTPSGSEATEEAPTTSPAARVPSPPRWPRGWPGSRSLSGPVVGAGAP